MLGGGGGGGEERGGHLGGGAPGGVGAGEDGGAVPDQELKGRGRRIYLVVDTIIWRTSGNY